MTSDRRKFVPPGVDSDVVRQGPPAEGEVLFEAPELGGEELVKKAGQLKEDKRQLANEEHQLWLDAHTHINKGGPLDQALAVWRNTSDEVQKRALLRNIVGEATKRGEVQLALELVSLEEDERARQRDLAHIAATCAEGDDWETALDVLSKVSDITFHDHALWRMVPLMAKTDKVKAKELARQIHDRKKYDEVMAGLK